MIGGRPSEMYDAVASILGLEQLAAANKGLRELAREYEAPAKEAKAELPALLILLDGTDDPRARAAPHRIERAAPRPRAGGRTRRRDRPGGRVTPVRPAPPLHPDRTRHRGGRHGRDPAARSHRLREDLRGTSAEDALRRAELLARALAHHRAHPALDTCRQQSNVALGPVRLGGSGTQRKVAPDVTVDDIDAPALGVMSQGELHSLALSLCLPRTFLPENPFRFLVIDDPVQSMDPAKVDGLARVLALLAEHRQVVVFTHDTRLPQALKYLRLPATVLTVDCRERSAVRVSAPVTIPSSWPLNDAKALARARDLPGDVVARVLPGLCRTALEAALLEPARRRLLGRGLPHAEIE
ncbi:ATP-binding protein [Streptomyces albofaciens]|uniref:ATP-binding protein n=1 Tax=Streptomyces albofaciens TaxID=66866 RepID=UPI001FCC0D85|nr:ATP-binding protein [Streptomyces albofaciens]